jgi:hypothetical protein
MIVTAASRIVPPMILARLSRAGAAERESPVEAGVRSGVGGMKVLRFRFRMRHERCPSFLKVARHSLASWRRIISRCNSGFRGTPGPAATGLFFPSTGSRAASGCRAALVLSGTFSSFAGSAQARRLFVALFLFGRDDGHGGLMRGPCSGIVDGSRRHIANRRAAPMLREDRWQHRPSRSPAHISSGLL